MPMVRLSLHGGQEARGHGDIHGNGDPFDNAPTSCAACVKLDTEEFDPVRPLADNLYQYNCL
jgi:hypothetical protein